MPIAFSLPSPPRFLSIDESDRCGDGMFVPLANSRSTAIGGRTHGNDAVCALLKWEEGHAKLC